MNCSLLLLNTEFFLPSFIGLKKGKQITIKLQNYKLNHKLQDYKIQIINYKLPISIYKSQNAKLQITEHKLQNAIITT